MARITFGLASSHSPMLNAPPEQWPDYAEKDRLLLAFLKEELYDDTGASRSFDELLALRDGDAVLAAEITPERLQARHTACEAAIQGAARALEAAEPDVVVVIGNDHKDVFNAGVLPALAVYTGEVIPNIMPPQIAALPPAMTMGSRAWFDETPTDYPGCAALARHLAGWLSGAAFDVAVVAGLPEGQGMAHAFTHLHKRLMPQRIVPMVPVFLNTFYPPNQPSPARCFEIGQAIRQAVEAWDSDAKVGVMCSGGLSHFVLQEDLDRGFIAALRAGDRDAMTSLPLERLKSGNSELRNWIAAAGAAEHLAFDLIDYIPCYRSMAGTGCGMAFGAWR